MNIGLTARVTMAMVALAMVTAGVVACLAYVNLERAALPAQLAALDSHVRQLGDDLEAHVDGIRIDLLGLLNSPPFDGYVRALADGGVDTYTDTDLRIWRAAIERAFLQRLEQDSALDQLRLISAGQPGMELIRVDRLGPGGQVRVTPEEGLQAKGQRDYIEAATRLAPDQVHVSRIDLNREFGSIDPRRLPVLRVAAPLHDARGTLVVVAVVNVDMTRVLERIRRAARPGSTVYVLNDAGTFLVHPERAREHLPPQASSAAAAAPGVAPLLAGADLHARVLQDGPERLGVAGTRVRPAGGPPVTIAETVPYQTLIGPVGVLASSTLGGAAIASLLAIAAAVLFARTLIRPLVQMTQAVTAGPDGPSDRAPVDAAGEIGVLARAYETMREEVRAKRQALTQQVEERRLAEDRFRMAVEASPNGMATVDATGVITMANAEACRLFGWPREHLEGNDVEMLVPDRFRPDHQDLRRNYMVSPSTRLMGEGRELYGLRRDGTEVPIEVALNPIDTPEGRQVLIVVADISPRKAAEARARRHQAHLEKLLDANPDGMLVVDGDGIVRFVNEAALTLLERSRDDLVGGELDFSLPREGSSEIEIPRSDGRRKVAVQAVPFEWDERPAYLAALRDVTARRRLEDQLRQSQKMEAIGRLAGGVAHDFNNLLTVILGYGAELQEQDLRPALQESIDQILSAAERASVLSRQLLLHARSTPLKAEPISLADVAASLEPMLRRVIGADVELTVKLSPERWFAWVDAGQIEQVLLNLVVNARDAMPDGGHLLIETATLELTDSDAANFVNLQPGDYVTLTVSDTGCGMDGITQQRIFEPFFTTKGEQGTGLGLATSYGVVKQAGGHISVYSEEEVGTTFKLYLPRSKATQGGMEGTRPEPAAVTGTGTILLVEDNDGVRLLAARALQTSGFDVLEAAGGDAALAAAEAHQGAIDLLLTDLVMPGMSGAEVAERLQRDRPQVAVLYMSGYTGDTMIRTLKIPAGAHYIEKPFAPSELSRRVHDILGGRVASTGDMPPADPDGTPEA
jgi:PAS domain S-box-containing protein